jgi:hypothetical protein
MVRKNSAAVSRELSKRPGDVVHESISAVGDSSTGVLACPKCHGTSFKAKRSFVTKALLLPTLGVGTALAPKTRVKCTTCGTEYHRG